MLFLLLLLALDLSCRVLKALGNTARCKACESKRLNGRETAGCRVLHVLPYHSTKVDRSEPKDTTSTTPSAPSPNRPESTPSQPAKTPSWPSATLCVCFVWVSTTILPKTKPPNKKRKEKRTFQCRVRPLNQLTIGLVNCIAMYHP